MTLTSLTATAQPANAATASACVSNPSPANCDGLDAGIPDYKTNGGASCLQDARQVGQSAGYPWIPGLWNGPEGMGVKVELWWSDRCQSNWARAVQVSQSPPGGTGITLPAIRRVGESAWMHDDGGYLHNIGDAWISPMVYSPGPAEAGFFIGTFWERGPAY